ncbi:MAG: lysophospholipid acyltransferase family protein [Candidatus Limnocylindrales bacterium]
MAASDGWQFSGAASLAREATARLFGPVFGWYMRGPRVLGAEHLAELEEPVIVCPTHASHLDTSALRLALGPQYRRRLAPAVAADYFGANRVRWFFAAWLGAFQFVRSVSPDSMAAAEALLARGWNILVFPEGTRTRTGDIGRFKPGVGLIAQRSGRPVLPVLITGTHEILPPGAKRPRRGTVVVTFGSPISVAEGEDVRHFVARLDAAVRALREPDGAATEPSAGQADPVVDEPGHDVRDPENEAEAAQ